MIKKKKAYKPTKNITIKDVEKPYARIFDLLLETHYEEQSTSDAFNDIVMVAAAEHLGNNSAQEALERYREFERNLEAYACQNQHS